MGTAQDIETLLCYLPGWLTGIVCWLLRQEKLVVVRPGYQSANLKYNIPVGTDTLDIGDD